MKTFKDYALVMYYVMRQFTHKIYIHPNAVDLERVIRTYPRLVCALNHGGPNAPVAPLIGLYESYLQNGGEYRRPILVVWRGFYKIPGIRLLTSFITQVSHGLTAEEFANKIVEQGYTDLFVFPEGENCLFSNGSNIVPFLSPRFIELALKANCPILVVVHSGVDDFATVHHLTEWQVKLLRWIPKRNFNVLKQTKTVLRPRLLKHRIDSIRLHYLLYHPTMTLNDLPDDPNERQELLQVEAENVRHMMIEMKKELDKAGSGTIAPVERKNRKNRHKK